MKICVSDRCFFPWSAFKSSKRVIKLAKDLGYEEVEFHPTWNIWGEFLTRKKLVCKAEDISSFHIDWRQDISHDNYGFFTRNFCKLHYHLFPPGFLAVRTLQKLEKKYKKQIVIHWLENINQYQNPILELHSLLSIGLKELEAYFKQGKIAGIVIDTHKFLDWVKINKIKESSYSILKRLMKMIVEVHFRFKTDKDIKFLSGGPDTNSIKIIKQLIKLGYQGRVVVEAGWPDAGTAANLWQVDMAKAKKIHAQIVNFLKSI